MMSVAVNRRYELDGRSDLLVIIHFITSYFQYTHQAISRLYEYIDCDG